MSVCDPTTSLAVRRLAILFHQCDHYVTVLASCVPFPPVTDIPNMHMFVPVCFTGTPLQFRKRVRGDVTVCPERTLNLQAHTTRARSRHKPDPPSLARPTPTINSHTA